MILSMHGACSSLSFAVLHSLPSLHPFPPGEGLCHVLLCLSKHLAIGIRHLNISRAWKPHHFTEISLVSLFSLPFVICWLLWGFLVFFFFYLLPGLVPGFGFPASTARKDSRCHGLAEVCTGKNGQSFSASCQALHRGITEEHRSKYNLATGHYIKWSCARWQFSLRDTNVSRTEKYFKKSVIKTSSRLEIFSLFSSWSQTFSCKILEETSLWYSPSL